MYSYGWKSILSSWGKKNVYWRHKYAHRLKVFCLTFYTLLIAVDV